MRPTSGRVTPAGSTCAEIVPKDARWIAITARRRGQCDLCGRHFSQGARIRYQPSTHRVRCPTSCPPIIVNPQPSPAPSDRPKRVRAYPVWNGEFVSLFDRGDYVFRKCVVCSRSFEGAAGRVAQAKRRGVCPACEKTHDEAETERLKEAALAHDRAQYRQSQR
jgi:hypothetical protein